MTKVAVITGASRGLGSALAEALVPEYHIVAVARTVGGLEELDDRIRAKGGTTTLAPTDLADPDTIGNLAGSLQARWGRVDLWAHTAIHAAPLSPAGHVSRKDWEKSVQLNITSTGLLIGAIEPLLLEAGGGCALFFEDACGGKKFFGAYGATKAAQIALARSWQTETAKIGPRVLVVAPDPMPTATRGRFFPGEDRGALTPPAKVAARIIGTL
ncbi:MAG: SDR family oxidoreductase [Pseudomonadota bacterium]